MLLDYIKFQAFLKRHFNSKLDIKSRLVGVNRDYDSGYNNIVRFFGDGAISPLNIKINYHPEQFRLKNKNIAKFTEEIEKDLRELGRMYDGPHVSRIVDAEFSGNRGKLEIQKCAYGTFAGSCFALDKETSHFGKYKTLRDYYINQSCSGLEDHPLALCLGICGIVLLKDKDNRQCLLVERSGSLASLENSIGPSAAGSVDYSEKYETLDKLINDSMGSEIEEELNLKNDEYKLTPLAYAHEIFRGEKPQIFCKIESTLSQKELSDRLDSIKNPEEFTGYQFVDLSDIISQRKIVNHEALMNCFLIEEYLYNNK